MNDLFEKRICVQHGMIDREDMMMFKDKTYIESVNKNYQSLIRPVCRKKLPSEQFEELDLNSKTKRAVDGHVNKRPISTTILMRPPSRHKSPPKALELEIPGSSTLTNSKIKIKSFQNRRPNTSKFAKLDLGNHEGLLVHNPPNLQTETFYSTHDQFHEMVCKTDEDEIQIQIQKNLFSSPILKNVDIPKLISNQKYSVTMYDNFKIDKINAAEKSLKSTPKLDLNSSSSNKLFTTHFPNTFVSNDRFLSEDHTKKKV